MSVSDLSLLTPNGNLVPVTLMNPQSSLVVLPIETGAYSIVFCGVPVGSATWYCGETLAVTPGSTRTTDSELTPDSVWLLVICWYVWSGTVPKSRYVNGTTEDVLYE